MKKQKQFEKKEITYHVVSPNGHDECIFDHSTALTNIRALVKDEGKWLYIDNDYTNPETLTTRDLDQAEDIILTNAVAGGN